MFKQGPIPAFVHGVLEYLLAALLIAAPFLADFEDDTAVAVSIAAGVLVLVITASTALPTGLIKSIPVQAHAILDYVIALVLIASPFLFAFNDDNTATVFFVALGVLHLLITIGTRFVRDAPAERPDAEERRGRVH